MIKKGTPAKPTPGRFGSVYGPGKIPAEAIKLWEPGVKDPNKPHPIKTGNPATPTKGRASSMFGPGKVPAAAAKSIAIAEMKAARKKNPNHLHEDSTDAQLTRRRLELEAARRIRGGR